MSDLSTSLRESTLREAAEAAGALAAGWSVDAHPPGVKCDELERIYRVRHGHVLNVDPRLAASIEEFLQNLKDYRGMFGRWLAIQGDRPFHYLLFEVAPHAKLIACFRVESHSGAI